MADEAFVLRHRPPQERGGARPSRSRHWQGDHQRSRRPGVLRPRGAVQLRDDPFKATDTTGHFDVKARIDGGGVSGQAGALRHGISCALLEAGDYRAELKKAGYSHARRPYGGAQVEVRSEEGPQRPQFSKRCLSRASFVGAAHVAIESPLSAAGFFVSLFVELCEIRLACKEIQRSW